MTSSPQDISGYDYGDSKASHAHSYLLPTVLDRLQAVDFPTSEKRVFDLGCGNGAFAAALNERGYEVTGVDPSEEGIRQARKAHPELDVHVGSAYDDLRDEYGTFPAVVSLEVVEHVYSPRKYARCVYELLAGGG